MADTIHDSPYRGSGQLTRQQFLFFETRTVAKLVSEGHEDNQIVEIIVDNNLFQFPTEKTIRQVAAGCIARVRSLGDDSLIQLLAEGDSYTAKQICLYAMMKQYRLLWDFMIIVIGNKYQQQDYTFNRSDILMFLLRLQEQDDCVASWSEATIKKIVSVISRILIENEYITDRNAKRLSPVLISSGLENAIRAKGDNIALSAFNCLI